MGVRLTRAATPYELPTVYRPRAARGNASADDYSAIMRAIDDADSDNGGRGGVVLLDPLRYAIETSLQLPSGVHLVGSGRSDNANWGTQIISSSITDDAAIKIGDGSTKVRDVGVRRVYISLGGTGMRGFTVDYADRLVFEDISVYGGIDAHWYCDGVQDSNWNRIRTLTPSVVPSSDEAAWVFKGTQSGGDRSPNSIGLHNITMENAGASFHFEGYDSSNNVRQFYIGNVKIENPSSGDIDANYIHIENASDMYFNRLHVTTRTFAAGSADDYTVVNLAGANARIDFDHVFQGHIGTVDASHLERRFAIIDNSSGSIAGFILRSFSDSRGATGMSRIEPVRLLDATGLAVQQLAGGRDAYVDATSVHQGIDVRLVQQYHSTGGWNYTPANTPATEWIKLG